MRNSPYPEYRSVRVSLSTWLNCIDSSVELSLPKFPEFVTNVDQKRATFVRKVTIRGGYKEFVV